MSVSFWCPEAPTEMVHHEYDDGEAWDEEVSPCEFNLSNINAAAILRTLGFQDDDLYMGQILPNEIPTVRRWIVKALSVEGRLSLYAREEEHHTGRGGASLHIAGLDVAGICDRLASFDKLLAYAQTHNYKVSWG